MSASDFLTGRCRSTSETPSDLGAVKLAREPMTVAVTHALLVGHEHDVLADLRARA